MSCLLNPYVLGPSEGGGGGNLPEGAISHLDFADSFYYAGAAERAVGDLLGGGFDPGEISASGLYFDNNFNVNRPTAIGAFFTDLAAGIAAGCTIVFEIDHVSEPYGYWMCFLDAASLDVADDYVTIGHSDFLEDQDDIWFLGEFDHEATGIHRIAVTLNRDIGGGDRQYSVSLDGDPAITQVATYVAFSPIDTILIGHDGDEGRILDDAFIRSITLYPAVDPATLPSLSALV